MRIKQKFKTQKLSALISAVLLMTILFVGSSDAIALQEPDFLNGQFGQTAVEPDGPRPADFTPPQNANHLNDFTPNNGRIRTVEAEKGEEVRVNLDRRADNAVQFNAETAVILERGMIDTQLAELRFRPVALPVATAESSLTEVGSRQLVQFEVAIHDRRSGAEIFDWDKQARLVVDMRKLVDAKDLGNGNFFLMYRDEQDPLVWHHVDIDVHDETGLISAEVPHFSEWSAGISAEKWTPSFVEPSVSTFSGAATYSYPIQVPAGRGGLQPSVSLSYSSRSIDGRIQDIVDSGPVADGWSLAEISIVREDVSVEECGGLLKMVHPNEFRLVLNGAGHRLEQAPASTPDKWGGTRYFAEDAPGLYVERLTHPVGNTSSTPRYYWGVITPDGTIYRMGYDDLAHSYHQTNSFNIRGGSCFGPSLSQSSYSWQVDEVTDVQDNKLFYDYLTKTTDEPVQNATPPTGATWTLNTTKTRIHEITYNLDSVNTPQSRIEFRSSGDNLSANTFTNRLESIYIYEGGASTPRLEYRLDAENKTVGSPGCLNYNMTPYAQRQNNTVILNSVQMVTGTDSNPATNDTPLTSMPATTFTHSYKPHFFKNSQPCFQFYYLTGVDNGYGGDFTFSYLSDGRSHGVYYYHGGTNHEYPIVGYSYVVDVLTRDDGQTAPTTVEYTYQQPCYNQNYTPNSTTFTSEFACTVGEVSDYNGPLIGFRDVRVSPKDSGGNVLNVSKTLFFQDEDRQGKVDRNYIYRPNGTSVETKTQHWYTTETLVTGIDFTYVNKTITQQFQDSWGSPKVVTRQDFGYNTGMQGGTQFGNQTVVWDYGNNDDASDNRTIITCFYPNDSMHWADNWIVGLPAAVRVFDGIEPASGIANRCNSSYTINLLSETRTVYDWDGSGAPNYNNYTNVPELGLVTTTFAGKYGDSGLHGSTNGFIQGQTFSYDSYGNPKTIVNENGLTTTVNYDNDLNMYPVSVTVNNSDIAARTTHYAFYGIDGVSDSANGLDMPMGAVRKITDPNGLDQIFEYDPFGRLHAIYEKESDRSPYISIPADNSAWDGDPVSRYRYWDNTWNSSMYSGWTSDPMLITEETRPYSFADSPSSTPGFVSRMATHVYYDGFGREIQIQGTDFSVDGLSGDQNLVSLIGYHANGQVDCQSVTFAVPYNTGFVTDSCSSKAHTSTEFDSQGRTTRVTGPDGNSSEMEYYIYADPFGSSSNVFLTNVFDANGHGKGSVTNARGELIQVIDFSGNSPSTYDHYGYVNYQYDKLGNLTQVDTIQPADSPDMQGSINPIVLTTQIQYDVLGRKVWMDDPDMGVWNYYYDAQGNLVKQHDANQDRICFYYDSLGRVTGKSGQDNPQCPSSLPARNTNGWLASYLYDQGANALGQLTRVEWERNGSYDYESFTYDNESRLDDHTRVIEGHSYVVTNSSFDVLHRPTSINNAYGENITLTYDHEGLDTLQAGSNMLVTGVEFNERRQMTVMSFQNGVDTTYSYFGASENFRLQQVEVETTSSSTLHLDFNYTYDDVGNILSITDNSLYVNSGKGGGSYTTRDTQTFGYDELNRLISADGVHDDNALNYALDYEYDAFGNITKVIDGGIARTYTYDYSGGAQPVHGVQSISDGSSFNYDANGNMFDRDDSTGDYTHVYDRENRLIEVTNNGNGDQIEFFYDATGQRTMSIFDDGSSSETTHYPFADYTVENPGSGSAEVKRVTYSFGGQQVAVRVVENGSNTMSYLHTDHLGSSSVSTNGSGAEVANSRSSFLPFGGERLVSTADLNQRGFTGHYENRDFGLTYMNARFYLPEIGRFATADTLIPNALLSQHYNRYTYTSNNPIIYTDPTGHCEEGYMGDDYEDFDCIEAAQTVAQNLGADILYINFNPWKPIKSLNESQTVNVYELGWDSVEQANDLIDKYDALLTTFEHTSEWNNELDGMLAEADKTSLERSEYLEELYDGTFTNWVTDLTEELVEHTLSDDLAYGVVDYRVPDSAVQMLGQRSRQAGRIIGSGMEQTSHIVVEYFYAHMMTDGAYVGASIGRFGNVTRTFYRLEQYSDALPPLSTSN